MTREEEEIAVAFNDYRDALKLSTFGDFEYIDIQEAFEEGVKWADNNPLQDIVNLNDVWHDASEEPKINEDVVLYDCCGNFITEFFDGSVTWRNIVLYYKATMWAYADDLLPKRDKK